MDRSREYRIKLKFLAIIAAVAAVLFFIMTNMPETEETAPEDVIYELHNVWIMEAGNGVMRFFCENGEKELPYDGTGEYREQVADIRVCNDRADAVFCKNEKITGKLLNVTSEGITLEGKGTYPLAESYRAYQIYGTTRTLDLSNLRIGAADTDYILEDGKIAASLTVRDETMEKIRVLLKSSDFSSIFHERAVLSGDSAYRIRAENGKEEVLEAGETLELSADSEWFEDGNRVTAACDALTGKLRIPSIQRSQGTPEYRGSLEIIRTEEGLILVNEVLLEEYLYAVVPSEMPASYPMEALKAQAVCARTYAYGKMLAAGLPEYGAHLDDSTGYQVYNNIVEHTATTEAVKATKGQILYYGGQPVQAYYYSTSCGHGTTPDVWADGKGEELPYLAAKDMEGLEQEEPWYRWNYTVEPIQEQTIVTRLKERYALNPYSVLTLNGDGDYESMPPGELGRIRDIRVEKLGAGDIIDELVIEGEKATVKVVKELNIRFVLNNGSAKVLRQDGEYVEMPNLLPSAFFSIETSKEKDIVVGYSLSGGGYGHGVGMSQNGAKVMAVNRKNAREILEFFYEDSDLITVY